MCGKLWIIQEGWLLLGIHHRVRMINYTLIVEKILVIKLLWQQ